MRFLADENFNNRILTGLRQAIPELDVIRVQDTPIYQMSDPEVLEWAASQSRIVLTHDIQTMTHFAYERVKAGLPMVGVIEVARNTTFGQAIEELSIMIGASTPDDFDNQVRYIPIR